MLLEDEERLGLKLFSVTDNLYLKEKDYDLFLYLKGKEYYLEANVTKP